MEGGKVTEFRQHIDGARLDDEKLEQEIKNKLPLLLSLSRPSNISIKAPVVVIEPEITMDNINDLGITELVGSGTSLFRGSIANRIYNINLASTRLTGILVKPGEEFSFAKALGDVSAFTGYKQAYVISGGRTILGDGGGVCQVSTTLFRALLNAGLPITERNQHAYRVSYYEQDAGPGMDAAVYIPSVDLKFKNDTEKHHLIQSIFDPAEQRLTFEIYGTKDGREVTISEPVILSQSPAPEPLYQDDPNLPKGQEKQIDWAAPGARVYFTRTVKKDGKVIYDDTFTSNYRPWQAVFLRGTKEN
jgi:vancomycin resistance protein YoaR